MQRLSVVLAAAMLVVAGLPAAAAVGSQSSGSGVQPGAQFAGAVAVQGAEVDGEIEGRALNRRLAAADTNESRAGVVARESERASERLATLRDRRSTLRERYENGSVSESEYRARLAAIAAESRGLERRLNETAEAASSLPPEVADARGVNASMLETLRADADSMNDDEAAEAAREIAGEDVGNGLGGPPEDRGPPGEGDGDDDEADDERGAPGNPGDGAGRGDSGRADRAGNGTAEGDGGDRGNAGTARGNDAEDDRRGEGHGDDSGPGADGNGTDDAGGPPDDRGPGSDGGNDEGGDDDAADGEEDDDDGEDGTATATA